ncbi:MAG TPA: hypothetical protein VHE99_06890 [Gammaproteobacteria bacterium]|nr:hypothetical protein [Gammaproteobacteria bacterium]
MAKITYVGLIVMMAALAGCAAAVPGYVQKTPPPTISHPIKTQGSSSVVATANDNDLYAIYNTPILTSYYPASVGIDGGVSYGPGTFRYNPTSYYGGF